MKIRILSSRYSYCTIIPPPFIPRYLSHSFSSSLYRLSQSIFFLFSYAQHAEQTPLLSNLIPGLVLGITHFTQYLIAIPPKIHRKNYPNGSLALFIYCIYPVYTYSNFFEKKKLSPQALPQNYTEAPNPSIALFFHLIQANDSLHC